HAPGERYSPTRHPPRGPLWGDTPVPPPALPLSDLSIHNRDPRPQQLLHGARDLELLAQQIFFLLGNNQAIAHQLIELPEIVAQPFDVGLQPCQLRGLVSGIPEISEQRGKGVRLVRYSDGPLRLLVAG